MNWISIAAKSILSGVVVAVVLWVSAKNPRLGGWVTTMPMLTCMTILWLTLDRQPAAVLTSYVSGVVVGLVHSTLWATIILALLRSGTPFPRAFSFAGVVWVGVFVLIRAAKVG
jgi:F0F1-type ATP synthase assembly protein I